MQLTESPANAALSCATCIRDALDAHFEEFNGITAWARHRFGARDWHGLHADSEKRLDLQRDYVDRTVEALNSSLGAQATDLILWQEIKSSYTALIRERPDFDLAQSFYNSVVRRVIDRVGFNPDVEFDGSEFKRVPVAAQGPVYRAYFRKSSTRDLFKELLSGCDFGCGFQDLDQDAALLAERVDAHAREVVGVPHIEAVEIVKSVFFRGKGAYLVGRVYTGVLPVPLVISLLNGEQGVYADAAMLTEDEVSIVFSFTRSYFHVEVDKPYALVQYLHEIMPRKPIAELYISIGFNKHGKTERYRHLMQHLSRSTDKFEITRGEKGMVMVVFDLPSYDLVFKIIRDSFDYPKKTTRKEVMSRYGLVFKHDRGGRLVDAQEFEHLRFDKARFSQELLDELLKLASNTVSVEDGSVVIKHLYTERKLVPLNIYFHESDEQETAEIVRDFGQTIKDLAATNIFPGDILLKNFGVTRHGRVVFYDYDELCLLTDCNFRVMPQSSAPDDSDMDMFEDMDLYEEPWYSVGENDVFPEEMERFLGLPPKLDKIFREHHSDLFSVDFWADLSARLKAGEVIDIYPYKESNRLR